MVTDCRPCGWSDDDDHDDGLMMMMVMMMMAWRWTCRAFRREQNFINMVRMGLQNGNCKASTGSLPGVMVMVLVVIAMVMMIMTISLICRWWQSAPKLLLGISLGRYDCRWFNFFGKLQR